MFCGRADIATALAGRLLVEADLLSRDLAGWSEAVDYLDRAAAAERVSHRLSSAESAYLKSLGAAQAPGTAGALITPVRLVGRLGDVDLPTAMAGDARRAAAWERAAVLQGRTMLEWGLLVALREAGV